MKKTTAVILSGVMLVSGCATVPGNTGTKEDSAVASTAGGAAIGAVVGCGLAVVLGHKCAAGAAIGGALGAAVAWTSYSQKVASAQQVNAEARRQGLAVPVNEIRLKDYEVRPSSSVAKSGGEPLQVVGDIKLYGQSTKVPDVKQSMILINPDGKKASEKPQIAKVENVDGAGHYRAVGQYNIPNGMPQGRYGVQTVLYLDGKEVSQKSTSFQVAHANGQEVIVMASSR